MAIGLWIAAAGIVTLAAIHSLLGERLLISKIMHLDMPVFLGSRHAAAGTIRGTWHLLSVAWIVMAIVVASIAVHGLENNRAILWAIFAHWTGFGLFVLVGTRGKHLAWIGGFLVSGALLFELV